MRGKIVTWKKGHGWIQPSDDSSVVFVLQRQSARAAQPHGCELFLGVNVEFEPYEAAFPKGKRRASNVQVVPEQSDGKARDARDGGYSNGQDVSE